jgi:hypothetical protein
MVLYNAFLLVARIVEIMTMTFLSQTCHYGRDGGLQRGASDTRYVIGSLYLIHALRAVIWIPLKACVKRAILPVKACIQYVKCSAWWEIKMLADEEKDEKKDKEQRGRDRKGK